jgi:hypothetical protein
VREGKSEGEGMTGARSELGDYMYGDPFFPVQGGVALCQLQTCDRFRNTRGATDTDPPGLSGEISCRMFRRGRNVGFRARFRSFERC